MKKILSAFIVLSILCLPLGMVYTTDAKASNTIKVGYIVDTADVTGVDVEKGMDFIEKYFLEIGKYTGRDYDVIYCELADARVMLNSGEVDLLGPLSKTEDRDNRYLFIEEPFGDEEVFLATSNHDPMQMGDYDAMSSATIGIAGSDQHQEIFDEFIERNQLSPNLLEIEDGNNTLPEGYPVELTSAFRLIEGRNIVMNLGAAPYYFVVKNGEEGLQSEIEEALNLIKTKEPGFAEELYNEFYGELKIAAEYIATGDELEGYKDEYVIAYSSKHSPFMYHDKNGEPQGIAIEMFNQISEILGINIRYVELNDIDEEIDMNLAVIGDEQLDYVNVYSRNYLEVPLMMVGDVSLQYAGGASVGYISYHSFDDSELEYLFYESTFHAYGSYAELREDYLDGELDFIVAGSVVLINDLDEYEKLADVTMVPIHQNMEPKVGFSNKLTSQFIDSVNSAIGRMDTGIVNSYVLKSVQSEEGEYGVLELLQNNREGVLMGVLIIVLILVGIGFLNAHERKRKLLEYLNVDLVTGLESEKSILEAITNAIDSEGQVYTLVSVDIDNYKYINNTYGYEVGTEILVDFANYLKGKMEETHIARIFADQFLILIEEEKVLELIKIFESDEKLTSVFSNKLGEGYNLSMSIGTYRITGKEKYATNAVDSANTARAASKKVYGRVATEFSAAMEKDMASRNLVVQRMKRGIRDKEFYMMYQPKLNLENEEVIGAEALVRWRTEGMDIYPDQFIPIFEENGFITRLDYYVLERVCEFVKANSTVPRIAVNLSGVTLLEENVIAKITATLEKHGIAPEQIQLEVTESAVIKDYKRAIDQIGKLRSEGFQIALDDFGAGESSLNRLKDFLIDVLKLDKEFLGKTLINIKGVYIIEYVIKLAKKLELQVVAEGVETREQADILKVLGCDVAQGYLFAKPLLEEEFLERLEERK